MMWSDCNRSGRSSSCSRRNEWLQSADNLTAMGTECESADSVSGRSTQIAAEWPVAEALRTELAPRPNGRFGRGALSYFPRGMTARFGHLSPGHRGLTEFGTAGHDLPFVGTLPGSHGVLRRSVGNRWQCRQAQLQACRPLLKLWCVVRNVVPTGLGAHKDMGGDFTIDGRIQSA